MTASRAAFLRDLPGRGFTPPVEDAATVGEVAAVASVAARRFAADVDEFAAAFWALPPAERASRWTALAGRAVGPAAARLHELAAGLEVVPADQPDADAAELAGLVRELFALSPRPRAARRVAWLAGRAAGLGRWSAAARVVLRTDLPLARLDPPLFDWLAVGAAPVPVGVVGEAAAAAPLLTRRGKRQLAFWAAVTAASVYVWLAASGRIGGVGRRTFAPAEVYEFRMYEATKPGIRPAGFDDWVRAGRPEGTR